MLDIKFIRENPQAVRQNLLDRNLEVDLDAILEADRLAREAKTQLDETRHARNNLSNRMKGPLKPEERAPLVEESKRLKEEEARLEAAAAENEAKREEGCRNLPNMTHPDAPRGKEESDSVVVRQWGQIPSFDFTPKDHLELMEALDLVDFEGGAKVAGQKFYYLKNEAVLLELALIQYAAKILAEEGFVLHITPDLARREILQGIGFNPRGESAQIYNIEDTDLSLVATAEITLGGLLSNEVLEEEKLPLLYAGISHCFRTEAGSAGRESRGLYRVHQFSKVEAFAFCRPEESEALHAKIVGVEERIYQELGVPYRVLDIATGDLGGPAYRKYDLEAWMPGRGKWGEITSASNCTDYQARRLNIRYKSASQKGTQYVHMLNGTAVAVSRTLIALIENGQRADGSIVLPACLGLAPIRPR